MNKRKHILCMVLSCIVFGMIVSGASGYKVDAKTTNKASDYMAYTGITRDKNGNSVASGKYVTREEFAQMLVQASSYAGEVDTTNKLKLFNDVPQNNKKAAYIQIAVTKGYMSGYLGGKFYPKKPVTLKEAIYGTLSLLGYTQADFKGNLSDARYEKYKELSLSKHISKGESDKLTKQDCENLFYNLLNAKQKSGDVYSKVLGYTVDENGKTDFDAILNKKLKGPYLVKKGWEKRLSSKLSSYTILLNNEKASSDDIAKYDVVYYIDKAKKVWVYNQKVYGTLENITVNQGEPQEFTVAGTSYTVESPKKMKKILSNASIVKGSLVALLLGKDGKVSYALPIQSTVADDNWKKLISFDESEGTVKKNDNNVSLAAIKSYDKIYYSNELKTVWAYDKKVYGTLDNTVINQGELQELTVSGTNYTVENSKAMKKQLKDASIKNGKPVVLIFGWDDKVSNVLPLTGRVADSGWKLEMPFDVSLATIYKNGSKVTIADIESNDVIYYSKELKTIWAYGKKVYGVIDSISPSAAEPDKITVAGNTYDLKALPINSNVSADDLTANAWGDRLKENGLHEGDSVVVLFGYNGNVADICSVQKMPTTFTGYVLSVGNKVVKNDNNDPIVKQVIHIVDTQGVLRDFPCTDTTIDKGSIVDVSFQYGEAIIKKVNVTTQNGNQSDVLSRKLSADARIIDVNGQNYSKITVAELRETNWGSSNVLYYKLNSANEITDLILKEATHSSYQYGILKKANDDNSFFQLTFDINGNESSYAPDEIKWNTGIGPKAILIENGKIKDMKDLTSVAIAYISGKQANAGDSVYRIADDVQVYYYKNGEYYKGTFEGISSTTNKRIAGYMDQGQSPIRVIVVTN